MRHFFIGGYMIRRTLIPLIVFVVLTVAASGQARVVDASDRLPVSAASIFDASGNMVGFTAEDGTLSDIPQSAYPITLRCMGYEQLTIEEPEDKTWEMVPVLYELDELVVVPVQRNVLKQTFYVREYFSILANNDTVAVFVERMANRFVPLSKDAKFGGNSSLRILNSRMYARYKLEGKDSVAADKDPQIPSMLSVFKPDDAQIVAPESFKEGSKAKIYEKRGKSGVSLLYRQNQQSFTVVEDVLAGKKGHSMSPWLLKLFGLSINVKQLYFTQAYRIKDDGIYLPEDLIEAGYVMETEGKGKSLRKIFGTQKPAVIRMMVELYIAERDFLSADEAGEEYRNRSAKVEFIIPDAVPPLTGATKRLVQRATAEAVIQP